MFLTVNALPAMLLSLAWMMVPGGWPASPPPRADVPPGRASLQLDAATPEQVALALQAHYEKVRDFSADFTHAYEGGVLHKKVTERGTVLIKKPGRMRWDYTSPEHKEFVSDGRKMYSYIPADKQVIIGSVPAGDEAETSALFLSGRGNLIRDFTPSFAVVPEAPPDTYSLKLVPKRRQQEFDWLVLVVDRRTMVLRMLVTIDQQGGRSVFTFTDLKENVGLSDSEFVFKMPRGVEIVTQEPRR
jgi:outer membrane lipoprotein carrier protein